MKNGGIKTEQEFLLLLLLLLFLSLNRTGEQEAAGPLSGVTWEPPDQEPSTGGLPAAAGLVPRESGGPSRRHRLALQRRHARQGSTKKKKICSSASTKCLLKAFSAPVRVCLQVHRHHLGLRWPDGGTCLSDRPLVVCVDPTVDEYNNSSSSSSKDLFTRFSRLNARRFSRLQEIQLDS